MYFAGIDIGSTMTKTVVIDEAEHITSYVLGATGAEHRRLANKVMRQALDQAGLSVEDLASIVSTGYGRVNVPFADAQLTEITCHARVAMCLFAAISTDTGSFSYGSTSAASLRVAAELVDTGIKVGEICRHIYESYPYARLMLLQKALAQIQLADRNRVAYTWVTVKMFEESGAKREDTEGLIDYARAIDGVLVAILFEETTEPGKIRISLRSKHPQLDVNSVARRFGGGGHREAAGARITGAPREIESRVLAAVSEALAAAKL